MIFVIFHGAGGDPDGNWFPRLKEKLEMFGQEVIVPKFPTPEGQSLDNWIKVFNPIYENIKKEKKLCFVGHSLGPLFILHLIEKYNLKLDSAIFVSPFLNILGKNSYIDKINKTFYKTNFDFKLLQKNIPVSYTLYSDNDPYVKSDYSIEFAKKLNSPLLVVKKAGHMNSEVNLNEFPLVFELCKTRIDLPLYQRYLAHRRELYEIDYVKGKSEEVIYLKLEEASDEAVFHLRNLQERGFCTFFTRFNKFWNTQSKYYIEARKVAKRIKDFIRVFVLEKIADLDSATLKEQIKLDLEAGINIRFCMFDDIKDSVREPDFGIWDDDYVCIVRGKGESVDEVKISSRKKEILEARKWEKEILAKSIKIKTLKDIKLFRQNN